MPFETISLWEFINEFNESRRTGNLALLVGAGISMQPPSSLPSGPEFRNTIVQALYCEELLGTTWKDILRNPKFELLVPEVVFDHIYKLLGAAFLPAFDLFRGTEPNYAHLFVARSIVDGAAAFTTNFDLLIEGADPRCRDLITHLHGNIDEKERATFRINIVGRGLSKALRKAFRKSVRGRALFVVGYSGADEDIRLLVRSAEPRALYWLVRPGSESYTYRNIDRLGACGYPIRVATGDLSEVLGTAADRSVASSSKLAKWKTRARVLQHRWQSEIPAETRLACISSILIDIEQYAMADCVVVKACALARESTLKLWLMNQSTYIARMMGNFRKMSRRAAATVQLSQRLGNTYEEAQAWNLLGLCKLEKRRPDPGAAKKDFLHALAVLESCGPKDKDPELLGIFRSQILNNIGLASAENSGTVAVDYFRESLKLKKRWGALQGIAVTSANLCHFWARRRNALAASVWQRRAAKLMQQYGFRFNEAHLWRVLGEIALAHGKRRQALEYGRKAALLYEMVGESTMGKEMTARLLSRAQAATG